MDWPAGNQDGHDLNLQLEELLHRIAHSRDESALESLYDHYSGPLFGLIYSLVGEKMAAEDILQELFVSVWDKAHRFDPDLGKAKSWLMTLARNRSFDYLDKMRRRRNTHDAAQRESGTHPGIPSAHQLSQSDPEQLEISGHVIQALDKLTPDQQAAIRLTFLTGLTQNEVAEKLGEPLGTIKARIRRGLLTLKRFLPASGIGMDINYPAGNENQTDTDKETGKGEIS